VAVTESLDAASDMMTDTMVLAGVLLLLWFVSLEVSIHHRR
jgi:hypothetical protein